MVIFGFLVCVWRINPVIQGQKITRFITTNHQVDQTDTANYTLEIT